MAGSLGPVGVGSGVGGAASDETVEDRGTVLRADAWAFVVDVDAGVGPVSPAPDGDHAAAVGSGVVHQVGQQLFDASAVDEPQGVALDGDEVFVDGSGAAHPPGEVGDVHGGAFGRPFPAGEAE
jgi:hypothetical protein